MPAVRVWRYKTGASERLKKRGKYSGQTSGGIGKNT